MDRQLVKSASKEPRPGTRRRRAGGGTNQTTQGPASSSCCTTGATPWRTQARSSTALTTDNPSLCVSPGRSLLGNLSAGLKSKMRWQKGRGRACQSSHSATAFHFNFCCLTASSDTPTARITLEIWPRYTKPQPHTPKIRQDTCGACTPVAHTLADPIQGLQAWRMRTKQ